MAVVRIVEDDLEVWLGVLAAVESSQCVAQPSSSPRWTRIDIVRSPSLA